MARIFIEVGNTKIEVENLMDTSECKDCAYKGRCDSLLDPREGDEFIDSTFGDYCRYNLSEKNTKPKAGELESNLPYIFPNYVKESQESIKKYCKDFCIMECSSICPLKKYGGI